MDLPVPELRKLNQECLESFFSVLLMDNAKDVRFDAQVAALHTAFKTMYSASISPATLPTIFSFSFLAATMSRVLQVANKQKQQIAFCYTLCQFANHYPEDKIAIRDWAIDYCIIKRPYENFAVSNGVVVADGRWLIWEMCVDAFWLGLLYPLLFILAEHFAPFAAPILFRNLQILMHQCALYADISVCSAMDIFDKKTCTMLIAGCLQTIYAHWVYMCSYGGGNKSTSQWNWIGLLLYFNLSLYFQTVDPAKRLPVIGAFLLLGISIFFNTLYNLSFEKTDLTRFRQAVQYCRINASVDNVYAYWMEWRNLSYRAQLQTAHSFLIDYTEEEEFKVE